MAYMLRCSAYKRLGTAIHRRTSSSPQLALVLLVGDGQGLAGVAILSRSHRSLFKASIAMGKRLILTILAIGSVWTLVWLQGAALAQRTPVPLYLTDARGMGTAVGMVTLETTEYGLLLTPDLTSLTPGLHGFHIHATPACGPAAKDGRMVPGLAAGGHFDPAATGHHDGPYGAGHLGDLPPLYVNQDGHATLPILAPRLTMADVTQRSLMIHANGDNFADTPAPLGGGGARLACGVIP